MATKSYLTADQLKRAADVIQPPRKPLDGDESRVSEIASDSFSIWLSDRLLERLSIHPDWTASGAIALGSWSRKELSPKSDVDLLFVGDEKAVLRLTQDFAKQGLKLRYRMPESMDDWTLGVEPFDILALIGAKALNHEVESKLTEQQSKIRANRKEIRKMILKAMTAERDSRAERFDSITNYLEPNLKYGSGGLRDLEQALALRELFPERFQTPDDQHAFEVLSYYKRFFLLVRQRLHLSEGSSDLLTAPEQAALSQWLAFKSPRDFMKEIQKGVSRVSFYADWVFEKARVKAAPAARTASLKLTKPRDLFRALKSDPSVLMQNRVRTHADRLFQDATKEEIDPRMLGRELTSFIVPPFDESMAGARAHERSLVALFRARLIDHCVPEFRKIVGHVQHDQYHRFSVDAHILQALRELGRLAQKPREAGKLIEQVKSITPQEWEILAFACLYHDIAKGRDGDHSVEGILVTEKDLKAFGKSEAFIREVTWIVEEHLILSSAAFKENPASPQTWAKLAGRGVEGRRISLLAVFTIVDIRATNPDAWTPWKESLLSQVVSNLENPESKNAITFARLVGKETLGENRSGENWVEKLDSFLISMVPPAKLSEDLQETRDFVRDSKSTGDLAPKVVRTKSGQTWIRFQSTLDQPGLFAKFVGALTAAGLGIRHASIHTFEETGVYDWFEVKTEKTPSQVQRLAVLGLAQPTSPPSLPLKKSVSFDEISLVSQSKDEWVVSFRGRDQSGALLEAANRLLNAGAEITWARVHTWGRQIDDVFGIKPVGTVEQISNPEKLLQSLRL